MVQKSILMAVLGSFLSTGVVLAQDEPEEQQKLLRFEPAVRVVLLSSPSASQDAQGAQQAPAKKSKKAKKGECLMVTVPGKLEAEPLQPYKAYPYGTTYEVAEGVRFRVNLSNLTFAIARGPARFTVVSDGEYQNLLMKVEQGDFNFSVDASAAPGQFQVATPIGQFTAMSGMSKLHVGDLRSTDDDIFTFRSIDGKATFLLDYEKRGGDVAPVFTGKMELDREHAFVATRDLGVSSEQIRQSEFLQGSNVISTVLTGKLGDVKLQVPISGNGKTQEISLSPGISVRMVSTTPRGSQNRAVFVLPLTPSDENYYGYVERRGEGFYGDRSVWEEGWPPEETEEGADGEAVADEDASEEDDSDYSAEAEDELSDFDNDLF